MGELTKRKLIEEENAELERKPAHIRLWVNGLCQQNIYSAVSIHDLLPAVA